MIVVTGGAGFIGSNVVARLNEQGRADVVVCDWLGAEGKWQNLRKSRLADVVPPEELMAWLADRSDVEAVVHMGANSSTTATDADAVTEHNFRASLRLLDWCTRRSVPLVYASSAATYGEGEQGFEDDGSPEALRKLRPLNLYGWSKHLFDQVVADRAARGAAMPPRWAGLKFFNVYGPNEYHKGGMMSVLARVFATARDGGTVQLFRSHRSGVADGDQRRDFIHVDDVVDVVTWCLSGAGASGIFNVGTGRARSFREMIEALFAALGREPKIAYVDMPMEIRDRYQYFTEASVHRLRDAGYARPFTSLEVGVERYVRDFLAATDRFR